ncbi:hypothetical protein BOTBODRAFT_103593 [Botryobasidium botryosum FD-172 SS1]|uniref:DH domain-containing protein n=1 Tax=Botryobasidium botryosum (strain FD-172 SS1) TaxID=930990 RepID=A0A067N4N5_BOTB1|nr:hypothetical protein BOTBODRAFT_103593 [Botryobasidium botryosum FD-172 SS1]
MASSIPGLNTGAAPLSPQLPTPHSPSSSPEPSPRREQDILEERLYQAKGRLELHHDPSRAGGSGANGLDAYFDQDEEAYGEEFGYDFDPDDEDEDDDRFVNLALLSHVAVKLKDKIKRETHVKGSIPYPRAFTGKDIVSTIQQIIQRELLINLNISTNDRRVALQVARSLQNQLFFYEVEWGGRALVDGVEDVYMFLEDAGGGIVEREELPTGVITVLTHCYSPSCGEDGQCYSYGCMRGKISGAFDPPVTTPPEVEAPRETKRDWPDGIDSTVLSSLPESEIKRQTIIHKIITKEKQYIDDLDLIETLFIRGIREANPPLIPPAELDEFIDDVFGNILDLRECNRRLLEVMRVREREQAPIIQRIGDVFLGAAAEFRLAYPNYVGHFQVAEKRLKDELESNPEFRLFVEQCARHPDSRRLDLKSFISRPAEHLQRYPVLLEAIQKETAEGNPDADFLGEAIQAIRRLSTVAQLMTFQTAMLRGPTAKYEWEDLVPEDVRSGMSKKETKRQHIIFELIKGEMEYVKDLEILEHVFLQPIRSRDIIPVDRLDTFIADVFHNFAELHAHNRRLLDRMHEVQREEHPVIRSVCAAVFDAALNWRDAYMEYIPHYPIAEYRMKEEIQNNPAFKEFYDQALRHPDVRRLDLGFFINRPIPRLLRYDLLLTAILDATPEGHEDKENIPQALEIIAGLARATDAGIASAKQKVELWKYNANLVWRPGEEVDMDLLDETRTLVHTGKLLRQPDGGLEWSGWSELFVLLFDNYLVLTKEKVTKDGVTKYHVNRRPIPLELLSLLGFTEVAQQRSTGLLRGLRGGERHADAGPPMNGQNLEAPGDSRSIFPCSIHHAGRVGGIYHLFAESSQQRAEWKQKLEEAMGLRAVVQEANKVFEIETLSTDTFLTPSMQAASTFSWSGDSPFTGKVTCSVPFSTADGRGLVAIGCAEGVWIGLRHDSKSMRRVLHLKMVTQCAMLEDFGIFLVLADKSLFAYHIEALVPSNPPSANSTRTPQKLNGTKDVQFFSVGTLNGRTLIIYMKKKGLDSVFRVLEPVTGKITEKAKHPSAFGRFMSTSRSEWFRVYRDFFLPSEAFDLIFLKAKIAIMCTKGFEIMDLTDFKSSTIPQRDDPRQAALTKRCESSRPMGMFRSGENEFLLCYDEFGLYVDRHGDPSRSSGTIEWEGTAERVAFHPPYVLIFDQRFVEIRHIDKGKLVQIIRGAEVRCIWDGRGASTTPLATPGPAGWADNNSQECRIHAVMKLEDGNPQAKAVVQHVFELVPTIQLYPGPMSSGSPPTSTYFPQQRDVFANVSAWRM